MSLTKLVENCRNEPKISPSWTKKKNQNQKHFCLEMPSCHTHSSNLCDTAPMLCLFWSVHTDGAGRRGRITLQRTFLGCGPFAGFTEFRKLKKQKTKKSPLLLRSFFHCHHWLQNFVLFFSFLHSAGSRELHLFAVRTCSLMEPTPGGTDAAELCCRDLH